MGGKNDFFLKLKYNNLWLYHASRYKKKKKKHYTGGFNIAFMIIISKSLTIETLLPVTRYIEYKSFAAFNCGIRFTRYIVYLLKYKI